MLGEWIYELACFDSKIHLEYLLADDSPKLNYRACPNIYTGWTISTINFKIFIIRNGSTHISSIIATVSHLSILQMS